MPDENNSHGSVPPAGEQPVLDYGKSDNKRIRVWKDILRPMLSAMIGEVFVQILTLGVMALVAIFMLKGCFGYHRGL